MKKFLAIIVAIGLILGSAGGASLYAAQGDPSDYDDIPCEHLPIPVR